MKKLVTIALTALAATSMAHAADVSIFGTPLKDAERGALRQALNKGGAQAIREEDSYWCDKYDAKAALQGADDLSVCYENKTKQFASATYNFPAFVDAGKVREVIDMVSSKYGKPKHVSGSYGLGEVTATWKLGGVDIEVSRGWPDTTVYLTYLDRARRARMNSEIKAEQNAERNAAAKRQSQAF
jgi:hypothetical protein